MAYENISFNEQHMAVRDGYFYLLDYTKGVLALKQSNGKVGFQFPINIPNGFVDHVVGSVKCLQYDGYSFWSLQDFSDGSGILLRQWQTSNFTCNLIHQIPKITDDHITYGADTFSVEYYNSNLTNNAYDGTTTITIDEYTDSVIYTGTVMGIGPSKYGPTETVTVSGVDGFDVILSEPLGYNFFAGDAVTITPSLLLFNNYFYKDDTQGSLIMLDPYTGSTLSVTGDIEYSDIGASKFTRLKGVLQDYPDIHTLAYVKGTNLKLRDMSDLYRYKANIKGSDDFTGEDNSIPDESRWDLTYGNPTILNNKLFCATVGIGHDRITSAYNLIGDFSVQASGTVGDMTIFSGTGLSKNFYHYMGFKFNGASAEYKFGLTYSTQYYTPIDTTDLLVYLKFEGDTTDSSGNGHDGIPYNSPVLTTGVDGIENSAYTFDGSSYIIIDNATELEVGKDNADFSVIFWLKLNLTYDGNYQSITHKGTAGNTRTFAIWRFNNSNLLHCRISTTASYNEGADTTIQIPVDEWTLVAYIKKGNNLSMYLNGIQDSNTILVGDTISNSGSIYIGDTPWYDGIPADIDNYRLYARALEPEELLNIYIQDRSAFHSQDSNTIMATYKDNYIVEHNTLASGIAQFNYNLKAERVADKLYLTYQTLTSGIPNMSWKTLDVVDVYSPECLFFMGLKANLITVSGSYFDTLNYTDGYLRYPTGEAPYYGIMGMDNVKANQSTIIPIYAIDIEDDNLYRLQEEANYYGADVSWSSYHYQVSPIRSFVDFITVDADSHILPATGRNTTPVRSVTLDQYGQGVFNRPVTFSDDDPVGFITTEVVNTDIFYGTGKANTAYTSGLSLRMVEILASVTQLD